MNTDLTFNDLPKAVARLTNKVSELSSLILKEAEAETNKTEQTEVWFDLNELIEYDPEKRKKPTWYSKISRNEVPHYKRGKKVYFLKSEIDEWLKQGRKKTNSEIEAEAETYLSKLKK